MHSAAPAGVNAFLVEISPSSDTISGQVTCDGNAMSGVTLTLSGSRSGAFTTDGSGVYSFIVPPAGTYTITAGSGFSPASVTFEHLANNQTADFSTACSYSVSLSAVYLDATSQTGPVLDVSAGSTCPWTASSGGFLTVTAGASGTGNGTSALAPPPTPRTPPDRHTHGGRANGRRDATRHGRYLCGCSAARILLRLRRTHVSGRHHFGMLQRAARILSEHRHYARRNGSLPDCRD